MGGRLRPRTADGGPRGRSPSPRGPRSAGPRSPNKGSVMSDTVLWEQQGPVGRITLNRPETLNAWTAAFGAELAAMIAGPAADPSVRAVLISGAGRGFSSGADLKAGFSPHPED